MPQKYNKAGQLQEYVPAGNGDASGEYGYNSGENKGGNKHFKVFKKPLDEQKTTRNYREELEEEFAEGIPKNIDDLKQAIENRIYMYEQDIPGLEDYLKMNPNDEYNAKKLEEYKKHLEKLKSFDESFLEEYSKQEQASIFKDIAEKNWNKGFYYKRVEDTNSKSRYKRYKLQQISKEEYDALSEEEKVGSKAIEINDEVYNDYLNQVKDLARDFYSKNKMNPLSGNNIIIDTLRPKFARELNLFSVEFSDLKQQEKDMYKNFLNSSIKEDLKELSDGINKELNDKAMVELSKFNKLDKKESVDEVLQKVNKSEYDRTEKLLDDSVAQFGSYKQVPENVKLEYEKAHSNCQRCVQAFLFRLLGYDVKAKAKVHDERFERKDPLHNMRWELASFNGGEQVVDAGDFTKNSMRKSEGNNPLGTTGASQRKNIKKEVKNAGNGAVYFVSIAWKNGSAHVFIATNENGKVRFVDPQSGDKDVSNYFEKDYNNDILPKYTNLVRVDNLTFNPNLKEVIENGD